MSHTSPSLQAFEALPIADFLQADNRPTAIFEIEVNDPSTTSVKGSEPLYSNLAFEKVRQTTARASVVNDNEYQDFVRWISSTALWRTPYAGRTWTCFILQDRWKVVSCNATKEETELSRSILDHRQSNGAKFENGEEQYHAPDLAPADATDKSHKSLDWTRHHVEGLSQYTQFIRDFDWKSTSFGPRETWAPELRQAVVSIMSDPEQRLIVWGQDNTAIYNEACITLFGSKHPSSLGRPLQETLGTVWDGLEPLISKATLQGEVSRVSQFPLTLDRKGYPEETFFSFTLLPLLDMQGKPVGALQNLSECTIEVVAERRMASVLEIGKNSTDADHLSDVFQQIISVLEENVEDVPFALIYEVNESKLLVPLTRILANVLPADWEIFSTKSCKLGGIVGLEPKDEAVRESITMSEDTTLAAKCREAWTSRKAIDIGLDYRSLPEKFARVYPGRAGDARCTKAVVIPVPPITGRDIVGFLILGLTPRRPYDDEYKLFLRLLNDRLTNSVAAINLPKMLRHAHLAAEEAALRHSSLTRQLVIRSREAAESDAKFLRMAQAAPVGMYLLNADGTPVSLNKKFYEICGLKEGTDMNFYSNAWKEVIHPDYLADVGMQWQALLDGKGPLSYEYQVNKRWQSYDKATDTHMEGPTWVLANAFPGLDSSGAVTSVMGWLTDISHSKWFEGHQSKRLEEALEAKKNATNFIDMTSHEMRNPLSAIVQSADGILTAIEAVTDGHHAKPGPLNLTHDAVEAVIENTQIVMLCASHQKRIVDDILTLSKLDSNLLKLAPDVVDPMDLVTKAVRMYEAELQNADISATIKVDEDAFSELHLEEVVLDPSRLLQVLINLLTNSIKFTRDQPRREIELFLRASRGRPPSDEDGNVIFIKQKDSRPEPTFGTQWKDCPVIFLQFNIKDTGKGLTEEEMTSLFHRFSQASPKTYGQYGGSGLGLFISRELTEMQGGQIGVASKAGEGSTFSFYVKALLCPTKRAKKSGKYTNLEANGKPNATAPAGSVVAGSGDQSKLHVLVVEDNVINQKVMTQQLRKAGCTVHVASHGGEALSFLYRTDWFTGATSERSEESKSPHIPPPPTETPHEKLPLSVVLLDLEMPYVDGLTCIRHLRRMEKNGEFRDHLPVIAVTANARNEQIDNALGEGMDLVVTKPFRIPELVPQIRALIKGKTTVNDGTFTSTVVDVDPSVTQTFDVDVQEKEIDGPKGS